MISTTILLLMPLVIVIAMLAFFAINSSTKLYNRLIVVGLTAIGLSVSFISFNALLSQPKPTQFEWIYKQIKEVEIVSAIIVNKKAIYAWILFPGESKPRYYVFDWNKKQAERLQRAMQERRRNKSGKIMMKRPFDYDNSVIDEKDIIIFNPPLKQLKDKSYEK